MIEIAELVNEHPELVEEIRRLKAWTGLPEKNDPRGPAPMPQGKRCLLTTFILGYASLPDCARRARGVATWETRSLWAFLNYRH